MIDVENFLIEIEQKQFNKEGCEVLKYNDSIESNSSLFNYMFYLDDNRHLRLGGRLEFCEFLNY